MKEGKVMELGTHKDLMARDGEYASLYNVQAQAFTESEVRYKNICANRTLIRA
jgi:ABC-type transport system involved in cytochrome bd biosynthesis fused ATPase/permease subunit